MRVLLVIPTYEPHYIHQPDLERFYADNFDSFANPEGNNDFKLVITDFASSKSYKAFLRNYVKNRTDCYLVDGDQDGSSHVAMNIAMRHFDYDYVIRGESDLRARDGHWLEILLRDFDDPKVQVVGPTVTGDGERSIEQNQAGPFERESRPIGIHEQFNLHSLVFSRRFFQHFDNRFPDLLEWQESEFCLMYQLAALGYIAKINFRVNLLHGWQEGVLPFKPGNASAGWGNRNGLREADRQRFLRRMPHLLYYLPTSGTGLTKRIRIHIEALKFQGWRYFYSRLFSRRAFEDFYQLDLPTKEAVMKALFYRPLSDYDRFSYSIYPSISLDAKDSESAANLSTITS